LILKATVTTDFDVNKAARMVRQQALAVAQQRSRSMRCNRHDKAPTIKIDGDQLNVSACCQEFAEEVGRAIRD
jgi:hypothetical protein